MCCLPLEGAGSTFFFRGCRERDASRSFFGGRRGRGRLARVVALDRSLRWGGRVLPLHFLIGDAIDFERGALRSAVLRNG